MKGFIMAKQFVAQLLVAAVQAFIQGITARLEEEERVLLLLDPEDLDEEGQIALQTLIPVARIHKHFGKEELKALQEKVQSGTGGLLVLSPEELETDEEHEALAKVRGRAEVVRFPEGA